MNVEKLNKELDKINNQIKSLSDRKKELEGKKQAAIDAELSSVFKRKKIAQEQFLVFNRLNEEQLTKILNEAKQMADQSATEKDTINTKETEK